MICRLTVLSMCIALLAGCGDQHHPAVRGTALEAEPTPDETRGPSPEPFNPHAGSPESFHARAAAGPSAAGPSAESLGPEVDLDAARFKAPAGWVRKQPRSGIVAAEFSLPRVEPDKDDGRLTVTVAGGSIQENIKLWRQQFGGKPEKQTPEKITIAGVPVTLVDFSGTSTGQPGMTGTAEEGKGYRMLVAILDVGGQLHFVKLYGPEKTVDAHAAEFRSFVQSFQPK